MKPQIDIQCSHDTSGKLAGQIRQSAEEVIERLADETGPDRLSIVVYRRIDELQAFFRKEKQSLGVVSEGETDFIATHEAWRGYPRIHICQERIETLPEAVVHGAVQHELAHAILHGSAKFYTFRFSAPLIAAAEFRGLDMPSLQLCVYLLSIALKDSEVIHRLAETGFDSGQMALLGHMLADTHDERDVWDEIHTNPAQRKIVIASFMKTLAPIVNLVAEKKDSGHQLLQRWKNAYEWLKETERLDMIRLATEIAGNTSGSFQDRLEQAALKLIRNPQL